MQYTRYFQYTRNRPDRRKIKDELTRQAIEEPIYERIQSDGRIRRWTKLKEVDKVLRVILVSDGETVHNAFFDRSYNKP